MVSQALGHLSAQTLGIVVAGNGTRHGSWFTCCTSAGMGWAQQVSTRTAMTHWPWSGGMRSVPVAPSCIEVDPSVRDSGRPPQADRTKVAKTMVTRVRAMYLSCDPR